MEYTFEIKESGGQDQFTGFCNALGLVPRASSDHVVIANNRSMFIPQAYSDFKGYWVVLKCPCYWGEQVVVDHRLYNVVHKQLEDHSLSLFTFVQPTVITDRLKSLKDRWGKCVTDYIEATQLYIVKLDRPFAAREEISDVTIGGEDYVQCVVPVLQDDNTIVEYTLRKQPPNPITLLDILRRRTRSECVRVVRDNQYVRFELRDYSSLCADMVYNEIVSVDGGDLGVVKFSHLWVQSGGSRFESYTPLTYTPPAEPVAKAAKPVGWAARPVGKNGKRVAGKRGAERVWVK